MNPPSTGGSGAPPLEWKLCQVFGERSPAEEVPGDDVISSVEFDKTGNHLAVGDRGGRVIMFKRKDGKDITHASNQRHLRSQLERLDSGFTWQPEYQYMTEFQSHEPEFDYLKSLEIEEKINKVKWCPMPNGSLFMLSTNDKTIKLWKVKERKMKKVREKHLNPYICPENAVLAERSYLSDQENINFDNGYHAELTEKIALQKLPLHELPGIADNSDDAFARCRKIYARAHDFNINSVSNNSDGETFISADDLRINLWNMEISSQCFNIVDIKPTNMEDLTEVITSAQFHPVHCNLLAYSSSRGFIRLVDMRQSAICDHSARILQDGEQCGSKSFFTEIIASISDIKFAADGRYLMSRDYLNLKLWDLHMGSKPVATFKVHEHLHTRLSDLYDNDSIFDKFDCCLSGDGLHFATGSYSYLLRIFSQGFGSEEGVTVGSRKNPSRLSLPAAPRSRRSSISNLARGFYRQAHENSSSFAIDTPCDLKQKLLHLAWHPTENLIACAAGSSLFMYCA
ncbi:serine/threonine protein phosphatase 2A 55 kDa regulatory subunit B beta isoform-like isoform X2 [Rhodamnia argentea]|uniref:Serine/threonine-protein phosphatase 2A 55 kDa regulatory subunit B n=1 Tax=Rhodamnia argentea TaxID=178133 RepID=A0ABM3HJM4_9MYRT|nr:serine/threonine protein phosphatase 2A 55 kDa regulatory subunit B beta isoform-like isoform X2 [Rhodamnia argentea]